MCSLFEDTIWKENCRSALYTRTGLHSSWSRKINPLCCFYDCLSETEMTFKQWVVSVKCFMLFWVHRTMRWLHWGVILHLTGCFLMEYTWFSQRLDCSYQNFFTFLWLCIVTIFFIIKPTTCTNFPNLLRHETLYVSGSFSAHHQKFIHCTLGTGMCHTGLKTAFEKDQDSPARKLSSNLYDIYQWRVYSE